MWWPFSWVDAVREQSIPAVDRLNTSGTSVSCVKPTLHGKSEPHGQWMAARQTASTGFEPGQQNPFGRVIRLRQLTVEPVLDQFHLHVHAQGLFLLWGRLAGEDIQ